MLRGRAPHVRIQERPADDHHGSLTGRQCIASCASRPPRRAGGAERAPEDARAARRGPLRTSGARAAGMAHRRAWLQPLPACRWLHAIPGPAGAPPGFEPRLMRVRFPRGSRATRHNIYLLFDSKRCVHSLLPHQCRASASASVGYTLTAAHLLTRMGLTLELTQGGSVGPPPSSLPPPLPPPPPPPRFCHRRHRRHHHCRRCRQNHYRRCCRRRRRRPSLPVHRCRHCRIRRRRQRRRCHRRRQPTTAITIITAPSSRLPRQASVRPAARQEPHDLRLD